MRLIVKILSTFFYSGYLPLIPGTFASLAGLGIFILIKGNQGSYWIVTGLILLTGFFICGAAEKIFRQKDPQKVVIDEVAGMLLSLAFLPRISPLVLFFAFILFRIFDWVKPYPIRQIQRLPGAWGIMLDDCLAALYANILLQVFLRYAWCKGS